MRRRDLIGLVAGSAALGPRFARAQQRLVGVLWATTPELNKVGDAALRRGLAEADLVEGPNLTFAARYANGDNARLPALASELAALKPNVIVAAGTTAALAAHRAAPDVPIVALLDFDGAGQGVFQSYARPENMVTGLTVVPSEIIGKNFEILRDIVSGLRSIGLLFRPNTPVGVRAEPVARAAAQHLGLAYAAFPMRSIDEVKAAFSSGDVDAIFTVADPLVSANLATLAELAIAARKPVVTTYRGYTAGGFLVSYGPDLPDIWRRIGGYAAKILAGANPSDLPVEMPSKLLLVINLKTAKALKITVPERLLAFADEVIE